MVSSFQPGFFASRLVRKKDWTIEKQLCFVWSSPNFAGGPGLRYYDDITEDDVTWKSREEIQRRDVRSGTFCDLTYLSAYLLPNVDTPCQSISEASSSPDERVCKLLSMFCESEITPHKILGLMSSCISLGKRAAQQLHSWFYEKWLLTEFLNPTFVQDA